MRKRLLSILLAAALLVSLLPTAFAADTSGGYTVTVTKTGIRADTVTNYSGYGSLSYYAGSSNNTYQIALISSDGTFLYPYQDSFGSYYYYDGIVSLTGSSIYYTSLDSPVAYYHLGEQTPFATVFAGTPMIGGVAVVTGSVSGDTYPKNTAPEELTPYLLGSDGQKIYQFSENYTLTLGDSYNSHYARYNVLYGQGRSTLGWYQDGLIPYSCQDSAEGGYLDSNGNVVVSANGYSSIYAFCEGYAVVEKDSQYGYIDRSGTLVIPMIYNSASGFSDGLAVVFKDGKAGYINKAGQVVIPLEYNNAYGASDGLAAVMKDYKWGLVDYQNNVVVSPEYDYISTYEGGVAYAVKDGILYILRITKNAVSDTGTDSTGISFTDVPANAYYTEPVAWAVKQKITEGTSASTFSPSRNCIRAQVITFLWRAAGEPEPTTTKNPFVDVNENAYYYKAVLWARENGITDGTSANRFSPNGTCTRAEVITFLYRFAGKPAVSGKVSSFTDVGSGKFYTDAVAWAVEQKISDGTSSTTFSPTKICTRAEVVTLLYRALADS
jgi:hypothetical protein